ADGLDGLRARRRRPRLGPARRRQPGPVEPAGLPAPRPRRARPAGGDRRADAAERPRLQLLLSAPVAARPAADGKPLPRGDARGARQARPRRRGDPALEPRPHLRRRAPQRLAASRRVAAPRPGVRGGTIALLTPPPRNAWGRVGWGCFPRRGDACVALT